MFVLIPGAVGRAGYMNRLNSELEPLRPPRHGYRDRRTRLNNGPGWIRKLRWAIRRTSSCRPVTWWVHHADGPQAGAGCRAAQPHDPAVPRIAYGWWGPGLVGFLRIGPGANRKSMRSGSGEDGATTSHPPTRPSCYRRFRLGTDSRSSAASARADRTFRNGTIGFSLCARSCSLADTAALMEASRLLPTWSGSPVSADPRAATTP